MVASIYIKDRPALCRDGRPAGSTGLGLNAPAELCSQVLNDQEKQHQGRCQRNAWIESARAKQFDSRDQVASTRSVSDTKSGRLPLPESSRERSSTDSFYSRPFTTPDTNSRLVMEPPIREPGR